MCFHTSYHQCSIAGMRAVGSSLTHLKMGNVNEVRTKCSRLLFAARAL
jgi:hypothetical protein